MKKIVIIIFIIVIFGVYLIVSNKKSAKQTNTLQNLTTSISDTTVSVNNFAHEGSSCC